MNPELLKRWESLTSAAAGDARAAARWGKLRRMLGVASASLLFAFVALTLVNAAAGLTVALLVLGVATGVATAWAYREVHAVSRLADARQQEMQAIIEAVEQHEKPRAPHWPSALPTCAARRWMTSSGRTLNDSAPSSCVPACRRTARSRAPRCCSSMPT